MKTKAFFVALCAMMLFAVQGHAQRERREGRRQTNSRVESRSSQPRSREARPAFQRRSEQRSYSSRQQAQNRSENRSAVRDRKAVAPQRENRVSTPNSRTNAPHRERGYNSRPAPNNRGYEPRHHAPAPRHFAPYRHYEPRLRHHHGYFHHHHHCLFDSWYWYSWRGYHNRFICHSRYHNRYFDNLLGYYLWGSLNAPTRLDLGNFTFTRYNGSLKVRNGNQYSYLDLYKRQTLRYISAHTTVDITTGGGYAEIRFYDDYGNEATYQL